MFKQFDPRFGYFLIPQSGKTDFGHETSDPPNGWRSVTRLATDLTDHSGRYRTVADKRHRVEVALADPVMSQWSNRRVAEWCGVSFQLVNNLKPEQLTTVVSSDKTIGRDGKARSAPKPKQPRGEPFVCHQCDEPFNAPVWHCHQCERHRFGASNLCCCSI
jgi:hypothetical protein